MKAEFINPFLDATVSVLKTMASLEATPGKPFIKKDSASSGDVSGIVGITGYHMDAVVAQDLKERTNSDFVFLAEGGVVTSTLNPRARDERKSSCFELSAFSIGCFNIRISNFIATRLKGVF